MSRFVRVRVVLSVLAAFATAGLSVGEASAQAGPPTVGPPQTAATSPFSAGQLMQAGETFFGQVSGNIATVIQEAVSRFGLPNGYILGTTAGGALIAGLRYGQGTLYTQNQGTLPVYWQGPSLGFDLGADVSQTMMLVYNLPSITSIYQRFYGVGGSAYVVGGVGMTVLTGNGMTLVPIISGVGARLGISLGYLRFNPEPTRNPF